MLLSRRKLLEKIMQNVTLRKVQNSIQATGDRMAVTPQQFGMHVGSHVKKAAVMLPAAGIGAGLGAVTSPSGHRMEGLGRGAVKGTATGAGIMAGAPVGALGMLGLSLAMPGVGKKLFGPSSRQLGDYLKRLARKGQLHKTLRPGHIRPEKKLELVNTLLGGAAVGAPLGGAAGYGAANAAMGSPSWEGKTASALSVLGGLAGGGIGGLAGGGAGGILGALGGGALGGGPGAGLGLLAGGAAGLGAGAHMGGNIGADIGRSFSKKKDDEPKKEESDEKEEKADEGKEEEVKKSAAAVLAQLQKNARFGLNPTPPSAPTPAAAPAAPAAPAVPPAHKAYEKNVISRMYNQMGAPAARVQRLSAGQDPKTWSSLTPAQMKTIDTDVQQRLYNQHGGAEAFMTHARLPE
jgi:hypothetical protein